MRSMQATPQYMPFILRNSDMAYSKSSGSEPYLAKYTFNKTLFWLYTNTNQSFQKSANIFPDAATGQAHLEMKVVWRSIRSSLGESVGMEQSFTATAMARTNGYGTW